MKKLFNNKVKNSGLFYNIEVIKINNRIIKFIYLCNRDGETSKLQLLSSNGWVDILDMLDVGYIPSRGTFNDLMIDDIEKKAEDLFYELTNKIKLMI